MAEDTFDASGKPAAGELIPLVDGLTGRTDALARSADRFAIAMLKAFSASATQGKQFDSVLKSVALSMGSVALKLALPGIAGGLQQVLGGLFGSGNAQPFAHGGVIGTPSYFPLPQGRVGVAGEAGPEAIMPLSRGADGRLGVAARGAGGGNVTVNVVTQDADSFRRSEAYLAGQIARAVSRGQRVL